MGCSLPGFSVPGIFQAGILEWVSISYPRGSSRPRNQTHISCISCIGGQILYRWATLEAPEASLAIPERQVIHELFLNWETRGRCFISPSSIPSFEDLSLSTPNPTSTPVFLPLFFNHFYCEIHILHPVTAENVYQLIAYPKPFSHLEQPKVSLLPVSLKFIRKNPPKSLKYRFTSSTLFSAGGSKISFIFLLLATLYLSKINFKVKAKAKCH